MAEAQQAKPLRPGGMSRLGCCEWGHSRQTCMLPPEITSLGFMETHSCRGMWPTIPPMHPWVTSVGTEGREESKYIYSGQISHLSKGGIYHPGHLSMYTFRLSNRVICRGWEAMEYGRRAEDNTFIPYLLTRQEGRDQFCIPYTLTCIHLSRLESNPGAGVVNSHQIISGSHSSQPRLWDTKCMSFLNQTRQDCAAFALSICKLIQK